MSILIEKLILEIKRIKKTNPSLDLSLDDDVLLVFFTELYDKQNLKVSGSFTQNLKEYTQTAISKFTQMGGNWSYDHELMLNTILEERFAMANLVKQANLEIEKVRSISDKRATALREKETQFYQISKQLADFYKTVNSLYETTDGQKVLSSSSAFNNLYKDVGQWIQSGFAIKLDEPLKIVGEIVGSGNDFNRLQSTLREREREIEVLRNRILEIEKTSLKYNNNVSGQESAIALLRQENERVNRELSALRASNSKANENTIAFVRQENERLNSANITLQSSLSNANSTLKSQDVTINSLR